MKRNILCGLFALVATASHATASAGVIVTYDVLQNAITAPNVTAMALDHGAGVSRDDFRYATFHYRENNLADAITANDYVTFGFQSGANYDLTNVQFQARSRNNGPEHLVVMASVDGGSFQQVGSQQFIATFVRTHTVDLSSLSGVDDVELRFYLWGETFSNFGPYFHLAGTGVGGTNTIVINGELSAVPEPGAWVLLVFAAGLVFQRRRPALVSPIATQPQATANHS